VHDLLRITNTNQNLQKIFIHNLLGWFLQHILQQLNMQIEPFTLRNRWTLRYSSHISFAANSSIFLSELPPSSIVTLASSFHLYEFLLISLLPWIPLIMQNISDILSICWLISPLCYCRHALTLASSVELHPQRVKKHPTYLCSRTNLAFSLFKKIILRLLYIILLFFYY
jgi:hypothetical protein